MIKNIDRSRPKLHITSECKHTYVGHVPAFVAICAWSATSYKIVVQFSKVAMIDIVRSPEEKFLKWSTSSKSDTPTIAYRDMAMKHKANAYRTATWERIST